MFLISVYEERQEVRSVIHKQIEEYAFRSNLIYRTLWMSRIPSIDKRTELFPQIQLALLSLDMPNAQFIAKEVYRFNKDCRIIFFSEISHNLLPLLSVRPIGFFLHSDQSEQPRSLGELFSAVISDIRNHASSFVIENRDGLYILKTDGILYFQSELKNVSIQCVTQPSILIVRKLSEIQNNLADQNLTDAFIRIHQSYLVNRLHIRSLDKRNHWVELSNGERLPISDSKYEAVRRTLSVKNTD